MSLSEATRVLAVEEGRVRLAATRHASCSGCSMNKGCGDYLLHRPQSLELERGALSAMQVEVGDAVRLSLEPAQFLLLSACFYVLPLVGLLAGTLLASLMGFSEIQTALAALGGLLSGIFASRHLLRSETMRNKLKPRGEVV